MKKGWFQHDNLTAEQAEELVTRYKANGVVTEKSLAPDYTNWIVSALLPEGKTPPRIDRTYQQPCWRQ
ncbi:hypothetical protein ACREYP_13975 [Enterobacter sp. TMH.L2]